MMLQKDGEEQFHQCMETKEVLHRVEEERDILHTIKVRRVNWISHILRRNCLLKHVIEGKIEGISDGKKRNKR